VEVVEEEAMIEPERGVIGYKSGDPQRQQRPALPSESDQPGARDAEGEGIGEPETIPMDEPTVNEPKMGQIGEPHVL
jgi:hypothetical protein